MKGLSLGDRGVCEAGFLFRDLFVELVSECPRGQVRALLSVCSRRASV